MTSDAEPVEPSGERPGGGDQRDEPAGLRSLGCNSCGRAAEVLLPVVSHGVLTYQCLPCWTRQSLDGEP